VCSKLNRHVQMKVAERGVRNSDEGFSVTYIGSSYKKRCKVRVKVKSNGGIVHIGT